MRKSHALGKHFNSVLVSDDCSLIDFEENKNVLWYLYIIKLEIIDFQTTLSSLIKLSYNLFVTNFW